MNEQDSNNYILTSYIIEFSSEKEWETIQEDYGSTSCYLSFIQTEYCSFAIVSTRESHQISSKIIPTMIIPPLEELPSDLNPIYAYQCPVGLYKNKNKVLGAVFFKIFDKGVKTTNFGLVYTLRFSNLLSKYISIQVLPKLPIGGGNFSITQDYKTIPIIQFPVNFNSPSLHDIMDYLNYREKIRKYSYEIGTYQFLFDQRDEAAQFLDLLVKTISEETFNWPFFVPQFFIPGEMFRDMLVYSIVCPIEFIFNPECQQFQDFLQKTNGDHPCPAPISLLDFFVHLYHWRPVFSFELAHKLVCLTFIQREDAQAYLDLDERWCYAKFSCTFAKIPPNVTEIELTRHFPKASFSIFQKIDENPPKGITFFPNQIAFEQFQLDFKSKDPSYQIEFLGDFREVAPNAEWFTLTIFWQELSEKPPEADLVAKFKSFNSLIKTINFEHEFCLLFRNKEDLDNSIPVAFEIADEGNVVKVFVDDRDGHHTQHLKTGGTRNIY